jgi:tetratricopeptide (TPR) repeat protein
LRQIEVYSLALRSEADLLFADGSFELALERYHRLAALSSSEPYPLMQMGRVLDALGRADEALSRYRAAVRVAPRSAAARSALARAYLERHEYLDAIREWRALAARNPRLLAPRLEIARAYREMGLLEEAVQAYSDALDLDPDNTAVRREMETAVGRLQNTGGRRD